MSEISTSTPTVADPRSAAVPGDLAPRPTPRVKLWAVAGGLLLLLQLYVWVRWVSGPFFTKVPQGPSDPPMYMKVPLTVNAVVLWVGLPVAVWRFIIRPWRRERRITLDGMLMGAMGLMFFQDPLLNYTNTWCVYNTWLFNRGAWSSDIPGWVSPEEPGRQTAEPLLTNVPGYTWGVLLCTIAICLAMGRIRARWPAMSNLRLVGITFAIAFVFDFVMEALILLPIGFYSYPGAIRAVSLNAGTYYQWPVYEGLMWGAVQTALCCLRFFTDDRGRTLVERGLDQVRGGVLRQQLTRFLAVFAAVSASFFFLYNLPAQWLGMHADPWPEDVQKRSYLGGSICGGDSDVPCPNPDLPVPTNRSGHVDTNGDLILPDSAELPRVVPF